VAGGGSATTELFDVATGKFSLTGQMEASRSTQTATLLQNGKVLVAGGSDANGNALATAELYDSTSGTFTPTGNMIAVRSGHTATLLKNGKVLITGGTGPGGALGSLATAELFDPASGTFAATAGMGTPRYAHTATLLTNGNVLVAGGIGTDLNIIATAEIFDPTSGTFASSGNMGTARAFHTATLLSNGTVLMAGGIETWAGTQPRVAAAEFFNPTSSTFSPTGSMTTPRSAQAATLLRAGTVLVMGGTGPGNPGNSLSTAEEYNYAH